MPTPHLYLTQVKLNYFSVDSVKLLEDDSVVYRVTSGGEVGWSPSGVFTVSCSVDVTNLLSDTQTCYLSKHAFE